MKIILDAIALITMLGGMLLFFSVLSVTMQP